MMIEAIKQYVLGGATLAEIEGWTAEDIRTLTGDSELVVTAPKLANLKRYALSIYQQDQLEQVKEGFAGQFGGLRHWLGDTWPDCEFEVADELGKPCIKIYPEGK